MASVVPVCIKRRGWTRVYDLEAWRHEACLRRAPAATHLHANTHEGGVEHCPGMRQEFRKVPSYLFKKDVKCAAHAHRIYTCIYIYFPHTSFGLGNV